MDLPNDCGPLCPSDDSEAAGPHEGIPSGPKPSWRRAAAAGAGLVLLVAGTALLLGGHAPGFLRSRAGAIVALSADEGGEVELYKDWLKDSWEREDEIKVPPFRYITKELEAAGETPPEDLGWNKEYALLTFSGANGALLLPSLEPPCELDSVKITVGVNSDSFNRGLGVAIEPPLHKQALTEEGEIYTYNGLGLTEGTDRNVIKFYPDSFGGELRIEGRGGNYNENMGFTPKGWTASAHKLHRLEITLCRNGTNTLNFHRAKDGKKWTTTWEHKLLDSKRLPGIYAWLDLGGYAGKPLVISPITLLLRKAKTSCHPVAQWLAQWLPWVCGE